jgi:hypothetical protein
MTIIYSTGLRLPKPAAGDAAWATQYHRMTDIIDKFAGQIATVTQVGASMTLTDADGTADQAKNLVIRCAQALTSNLTVIVPTRTRLYLVDNSTSGAFTMTVKTAAGTGVTVKQGRQQWVRCDGVNVVAVSRLSGLVTATEMGTDVVTATNLALKDSAVTNAKIAANTIVPATKLAGGASFGRILYTATAAGFAYNSLVRGTANQELAMSTAVNPLPVWKTPPYRAIATSSGIAMVAAGNTITYTHGLTGITNKYDYKMIRAAFECISSDLGYSVGDVIYRYGCEYGSTGGSFYVYADSTTAVKLLFGDSNLPLGNKSTGAGGNMTPSKWVVRVQVAV